MRRRTFLGSTITAGLSLFLPNKLIAAKKDYSWGTAEQFVARGLRIKDALKILNKGEKNNCHPILREEILDNPDAVFIIYAGIKNEKDENGKWKQCNDNMELLGRRVAELIFRKGAESGGRTFIKPNMVGGNFGESKKDYINNGWIVNPYFTVGIVDRLRDLGNLNIAAGARGSLHHEKFIETGILEVFNEHKLPLIEAFLYKFDLYKKKELNWHNNPEGMIARRFPTYRPAFDKGTTFINIAHAHTHQLGLTSLSIKNLQGIMPFGYGQICDTWTGLDKWRKTLMKDFNRDYRLAVEKSYIKHGDMDYKYWDEGGFYTAYKAAGGYNEFLKNPEITDSRIFWIEQWAQRMMDTIQVMPPPYLNIVEGAFGRGDDTGVQHSDFVTVGRSMTSVDAVTSWLMGHDPRELPYLRIARERGVGENDIEKIPIYALSERGVEKVKDYRELKRYPMGVYIFSLKENGPRYF